MNQILKITLSIAIATNLLAIEVDEKRDRIHSVRKVVDSVGKLEKKDVSVVENFKTMFSDGKVSGQVRAIYAGYDQKEIGSKETYATAVGGILKYELAEYNGFNAGVAFYTSHDIGALSGSADEQNPELSSSTGSYTVMSEAYINYRYEDLNLRAGRQTLDTPLADSDDIRMIQNTFEAYVATYNLDGAEFMAGNIQSWQGYDAGLNDSWIGVGESGANFAGVAYHDGLEFNAWYYNITQTTNAIYLDAGLEYEIDENMMIHTVVQYLNETELDSSGYAANIYGALFEYVIHDIGFNIAFDKALKQKGATSFSGTGGGSMFTSMDTMIIDEIAEDRDALAIVAGISYSINDFGFLYAYGDFKGDKNSLGVKAHIVEQDIGFEYNVNNEFVVAAIYVLEEDRESSIKTQNDWNRAQVMVKYDF